MNPPLVRMIASLPVLAAGVKVDWRGLSHEPDARADFIVGGDLMAANGERSFFLLAIARWACVPFAWIGGVVCFLWARDLYGTRSGLLAAALWCFSPNMLAHGALITPDMPATAMFVATSYLFWRWLRRPIWEHAILVGIVLGVTQLTKTTFVVLYVFLPLLWCSYRLFDRAKTYAHRWLREGGMLFAGVVISLVMVNLGYGLEGCLTRLGEFRFVSRMFTGDAQGVAGNRFADTWMGSVPVPLPSNYVRGIDVQRRDFEHFGRPSYLAGEFRDTGWWYYYLYALAIKVPIGLWGLVLTASAFRLICPCPPGPPGALQDEVALLSPAVLILAAVSSQTGITEHLRYALPMAPFLLIWSSQLVRADAIPRHALERIRGRVTWHSRRAVLTASLVVWAVGSSLWSYPHSISYFNELAGGPSGGHAYLLGSNSDWGQDIRYLKWWRDNDPNEEPLHLAYCGHCDPLHLGLRYSAPPPRDPDTKQMPDLPPGWYAISVNFLRGCPWFAPDGQGGYEVYDRYALSYFLKLRPVAFAGTSIYIYHI